MRRLNARFRRWRSAGSPRLRLVGLAAALAAALTGPQTAVAQVEDRAPFVAAHTSAEEVDRFLDALRGALARDDRAAVAAMMKIPLWAWDGRRYVKIESDAQLAEAFDLIFDSTLRSTIEHASSASAVVRVPAVTFDNSRLVLLHYAIDGLLRIASVSRPVPAERAERAAEPPATP